MIFLLGGNLIGGHIEARSRIRDAQRLRGIMAAEGAGPTLPSNTT
jgi:hypothetical protein